MSEREIQNNIMLAIGGRSDVRLWRQNAGKFFHVPNPCPRCRTQGRWIAGAPKGAADISGVFRGKCLQIEVKASTNQSHEQAAWERMIRTQGGIYVLARSVEDVQGALLRESERTPTPREPKCSTDSSKLSPPMTEDGG